MGNLKKENIKRKLNSLLWALVVVFGYITFLGVAGSIGWALAQLIMSGLVWPWIVIGGGIIILSVWVVYRKSEKGNKNQIGSWSE